ncbi:hypothetical protein [Streptomyces sp. 8P21H-1]|uniref:hypothetical protein n=1 Tax=Streptomyces sp. 8P21H-1 TaxID=2737048 RepID=UPI00156F9364|nr:hypothetical protein [Streptomyces sp. 8P21H-1]NSL42870.1 hypothetical protein [Streptomyces sp. 8P21H-1]
MPVPFNATVNRAEGPVHGLIRSTACSEPGDTRAPAYSGTLAVGFLVGAGGDCTSGGVSCTSPSRIVVGELLPPVPAVRTVSGAAAGTDPAVLTTAAW